MPSLGKDFTKVLKNPSNILYIPQIPGYSRVSANSLLRIRAARPQYTDR